MQRTNLINKLKRILEPLVNNYDNIGSFGEHESCHGPNISWFEMFCRSSYGIIAYTKATNNKEYLNKFSDTLLKVIQDNRYVLFNNYDQKAVELVPVATLLLIYRKDTWDTYTQEQKSLLVSYFENINKIELCSNNWFFFRILVCSILHQLTDIRYDNIVDKCWRFIDKCYQGEGWYRDGISGTIDYYNSFGFHFYSLLYYYLFEDNERKQVIKERALLFAKQFIYFVDVKGRFIPYGRSLIYRYATSSFWSMMMVNRLLSEEEEKVASLIISRNFDWWSKQCVYDQQGIQCLGYAYPNDFMLESYNSSGSVYWSLKLFMLLLANDDSQIWKDQVNTVFDNRGIYKIANGNIIIQVTNQGNVAFINSFHGAGQSQDFAKYMHFAYHSYTGFNITKSIDDFTQLSDDSSLIFDIDGQKMMRKENLLYTFKDNFIQEFVWRIADSIDIVTTVIPLEDFYVRIHVIRSKIPCVCYETGYPVQDTKASETFSDNTLAFVDNKNVTSVLKLIKGQGIPIVVQNEENSNIYYRKTIMPVLRYIIKKGTSVIVDLTGLYLTETTNKEVIDNYSNHLKIADDYAIVNNRNIVIRIPLFFTKNVTRQLFLAKKTRQYHLIKGNIKKTIKRFIKRK